VVFPNEYRVGMANLGLHAVVETLWREGAWVDRAFLPARRQVNEHRRSSAPVLSIEAQRPLSRFDALLFSISFEPDYCGMVQMLRLSGIEPLASRRSSSDPLILAGGMAPSLNPEPIAPFCDLIGIGEAEAILPPLVELMRRGPRYGVPELAGELPGWYAPDQGPSPVARQHAPLVRPASPVVISPRAEFPGHVDLEISRGCRWRCRFCAAGHVVAPYRELQVGSLDPALQWAVDQRGRVGLVGTDVSDHSGLEAIASEVWSRGGELAWPSLRVESLGRSIGVAAKLIGARPPQTLTLGIEAATPSLRAALGKRLSGKQIQSAVMRARAAGVQNLRVYLLVGVLGERWDEVQAIVELKDQLLADGPSGTLTFSVNGVVPKAGTPLQWEPAPDRAYLRKVRDLLRRSLPAQGRVELTFESPDWTRWQSLLSLGDRRAAAYILEAAERGWRPVLARASREEPLLQGVGRWEHEELPWDHVRHHPDADGTEINRILKEERRRCLAREYVPPSRVGS
jgi:radical SAM superfamily enzyme YgiQ (UPF0313 family)